MDNQSFTQEIIMIFMKRIQNKICQVVCPVNQPKIMSLNSKKNCYKESRFSYIRPDDGITRLKVYNCSNITGLENVIHKSSQVIVEIPNGCI